MPDPNKDKRKPSISSPEEDTGTPQSPRPSIDTEDQEKRPPASRSPRSIVPIILCLILVFSASLVRLEAQLETSLTLQGTYSDNVFQLSEYDFERFEEDHPNLEYADTTDDLTLAAKIDLAYSMRYKWYRITPSLTGTLSQNVSNTAKQRRDALLRLKVERHYWNLTALYGFYPYIYVRDYVDTDGTNELEHYSYERNLYRGDLNIKPFSHSILKLHARYEQYYYNQYWTQYDGNATTFGLGWRQSFPVFIVEGMYHFRKFDNVNAGSRDSSYESNLYSGNLRLKSMPLSESKPQSPTWYPSLALSYEERFFQSNDDWYGGRTDKIYLTRAALNFDLDPRWNLKLDYSHTFRNVDSPVVAVIRLREYGENRISAAVKYKF